MAIHSRAGARALSSRFLELLLDARRAEATELILGIVEDGKISIPELYLQVFEPVLREVGQLWQDREISIAQEHFISATTQFIMSRLYPKIFSAEPRGRWMIAACAGPEMHEIGLRMVADFFEFGGWDTYYVGANLPIEAVLTAAAERQADLLALSATMPRHVADVREIIQRLRSDDALRSTTVLVGGGAFCVEPDLWRSIGADGFTSDAASAVTLAEQLYALKAAQ